MKTLHRKSLQGWLAGSGMGLAGLVPGISSATIAVIAGVYRPMIEAAHHVFSRGRKQACHVVFFFSLIAGLLLSTFAFAHAVENLTATHPESMQLLFIGLIFGTLPLLIRQMPRQRLRAHHLAASFLCLILAVGLGLWQPAAVEPLRQLTPLLAAKLFVAGILCASAALIPGISGSAVLMALGLYTTMIAAIRDFNLPLLLFLLAGVLFGLGALTKLLHHLVRQHLFLMNACLTGFLIGSALLLWPPLSGRSAGSLLQPALLLLAGFGVAFSGYALHRKKEAMHGKEKQK